jgi:hypothetical protein
MEVQKSVDDEGKIDKVEMKNNLKMNEIRSEENQAQVD